MSIKRRLFRTILNINYNIKLHNIPISSCYTQCYRKCLKPLFPMTYIPYTVYGLLQLTKNLYTTMYYHNYNWHSIGIRELLNKTISPKRTVSP